MQTSSYERVAPSDEGAAVFHPKQSVPDFALAQVLLYCAFIQCRYTAGNILQLR